MRIAIIKNDTVANIVEADSAEIAYSIFPDCACKELQDNEYAEIGQRVDQDGNLLPAPEYIPEPVMPEPTPLPNNKVSPVEFKLLWTTQERTTITGLKTTDPIVADFYSIIDDPRLTFVNLSLASTQQSVDYLLSKLVEAAILTADQVADRRAAILSGTLQ